MMQKTANNRSQQRTGIWGIPPQLLALGGVAGPILYTLVFILAGFFHPGYSSLEQPISNLGALEPNAWIQNANFVVSGLLFIAFAFGFFQMLRPMSSGQWLKVSTVFLVLSGVGLACAGFFHTDIPGFPPTTVHGVIHNIIFFVVYLSLLIALFIIGWHLRKIPFWRGYGWYSIITGLVMIGLFFGLGAASTHHLGGLFQRIFELEAYAWYVVMGLRLFTLGRSRQGG